MNRTRWIFIINVHHAVQRSPLLYDFERELGNSLFQSFQIDVADYLNVKMLLFYKLNRNSEEIENYPYYEYQLLIENYLELLGKINEKRDGTVKLF